MRYLTNSWQDEAPTWAPNGRIVQFFRTARNCGASLALAGRSDRAQRTPPADHPWVRPDPAWGPVLP